MVYSKGTLAGRHSVVDERLVRESCIADISRGSCRFQLDLWYSNLSKVNIVAGASTLRVNGQSCNCSSSSDRSVTS